MTNGNADALALMEAASFCGVYEAKDTADNRKQLPIKKPRLNVVSKKL